MIRACLVVMLVTTVLPSSTLMAQTAVGVWVEEPFSEVYLRHDWDKGHLLYEYFDPELNQLTIGLGEDPQDFEWQVRLNDADQVWLGAKKGFELGGYPGQARVLLGLNSHTPDWYYLTFSTPPKKKGWGGHFYTLYKDKEAGPDWDIYLGPTYTYRRWWVWAGPGLTSEGGGIFCMQYRF